MPATWRPLREDCLNDAERELLDLRLNGLNDRQIAEAIGRTHGAVRTAQYRMVQKLQDCMDTPLYLDEGGGPCGSVNAPPRTT